MLIVHVTLILFPSFLSATFFFLFQDSEFFPGTEPHKKKRKHSSDEFCYRGKVLVKQEKGLTNHDFKERMLGGEYINLP